MQKTEGGHSLTLLTPPQILRAFFPSSRLSPGIQVNPSNLLISQLVQDQNMMRRAGGDTLKRSRRSSGNSLSARRHSSTLGGFIELKGC